jgi:predicted nuclease with TOPRIM domain
LGALVYWFRKSRDAWKRKYRDLKAEVHRMKVRVADLIKSRDRWRERAEVSEAKVAELQSELERLQAYVSEPPNDQIKTQPTIGGRRAPKRLGRA